MIRSIRSYRRSSARLSGGAIMAIRNPTDLSAKPSERPPWFDTITMSEVVEVLLSGEPATIGAAVNGSAINEVVLG